MAVFFADTGLDMTLFSFSELTKIGGVVPSTRSLGAAIIKVRGAVARYSKTKEWLPIAVDNLS